MMLHWCLFILTYTFSLSHLSQSFWSSANSEVFVYASQTWVFISAVFNICNDKLSASSNCLNEVATWNGFPTVLKELPEVLSTALSSLCGPNHQVWSSWLRKLDHLAHLTHFLDQTAWSCEGVYNVENISNTGNYSTSQKFAHTV